MHEAGMTLTGNSEEDDKLLLVTFAYVLFDTREMEAANVSSLPMHLSYIGIE